MKMRKYLVLVVSVILLILAAGCTAQKRPAENGGDPTGSGKDPAKASGTPVPGKETPTPDPDKPTPTQDPNAPTDAVTPTGNDVPSPTDSGSARNGMVTAYYYGSEREDFEFTEDYWLFGKPDMYWKLDLNGNTIHIRKTVVSVSQCEIINGTVIIECETGFRITEGEKDGKTFRGRLSFTGTDDQPLNVTVKKGSTGFLQNYEIRFKKVTLDNYGIVFQPDLEFFAKGSYDVINPSIEDSVFNILDGIMYVNPPSDFLLTGFNLSNSIINIKNGAIGIDNFGDLRFSYWYNNEINLYDGSVLYNHLGATATANFQSGFINVSGGICFTNDGDMNVSGRLVLLSGIAVYNNGTFSLASGNLDIYTVPGICYTETAIYNTETGNMELPNRSVRMVIFNGDGATAVSNMGYLSYYTDVYIGAPVPDSSYATAIYSSDLYKYINEFVVNDLAVDTTVSKCIGVMNGPTGKLDLLSEGTIRLNTTAAPGSKYTDMSIGLFNAAGGYIKGGSFNIFVDGRDCIGFYNDKDTSLNEIYDRTSFMLTVKSSKDINSEERDALLHGKNIIGMYNAGTKFNRFGLTVDINADDSYGFINDGVFSPIKESEYGMGMRIYMRGNNSTCLKNTGTIKRNGASDVSIDLLSLGTKDNVLLENSGRIEIYQLELSARTGEVVLLKNSGAIVTEDRFRLLHNTTDATGSAGSSSGSIKAKDFYLTEREGAGMTSFSGLDNVNFDKVYRQELYNETTKEMIYLKWYDESSDHHGWYIVRNGKVVSE